MKSVLPRPEMWFNLRKTFVHTCWKVHQLCIYWFTVYQPWSLGKSCETGEFLRPIQAVSDKYSNYSDIIPKRSRKSCVSFSWLLLIDFSSDRLVRKGGRGAGCKIKSSAWKLPLSSDLINASEKTVRPWTGRMKLCHLRPRSFGYLVGVIW